MFYYSITRMGVLGNITIDKIKKQVSGIGLYDHEFGGDIGSFDFWTEFC